MRTPGVPTFDFSRLRKRSKSVAGGRDQPSVGRFQRAPHLRIGRRPCSEWLERISLLAQQDSLLRTNSVYHAFVIAGFAVHVGQYPPAEDAFVGRGNSSNCLDREDAEAAQVYDHVFSHKLGLIWRRYAGKWAQCQAIHISERICSEPLVKPLKRVGSDGNMHGSPRCLATHSAVSGVIVTMHNR